MSINLLLLIVATVLVGIRAFNVGAGPKVEIGWLGVAFAIASLMIPLTLSASEILLLVALILVILKSLYQGIALLDIGWAGVCLAFLAFVIKVA